MTLAGRDAARPSFSHTDKYNAYYRGRSKGPAVGELVEHVTRLVAANDR